MKKLFNLIIFLSLFSYGQTYYGYKSRSNNGQTETPDSKISCDEAVKLVESKGRYLGASFGGYNDKAIDKIRWYEYDNKLLCIVFFKTNIYKSYIYGGWSYNFNKYYSLKNEFDKWESKGEYFWEYIEDNKIDCY
jgi:hypothetical protein